MTMTTYDSPSERSLNSDETGMEDDMVEETIGVFGGQGATGRHFIKLALDAGYLVRALAADTADIEMHASEQVAVIEGELTDKDALRRVVDNSTYVVCLLVDTLPKKRKEYKANCMADFVKGLYPLMVESCTRLFLYQATSLTIDASHKTPVLANVLKLSSNVVGKNMAAKDHDRVVQFIGENRNEYFDFIVTRPGLLREGSSRKRLCASKSLPGPVPVRYVDLAEFTLGALKTEKLFNSCPYVVGDGF